MATTSGLTKEDSIERSAERMFGMPEALAARILNAIRG